MFGKAAQRLLREKWTDINTFAEEVYALLNTENIPLTHSGTITLTTPPGSTEPAIQVFGGGGFAFSLTRGGNEVVLDSGGLDLGEDGEVTEDDEDEEDEDTSEEDPAVFTGTILSGSGDSYTVRKSSGGDVDVTQLSIAEDEVIPVGTSVMVFNVNGTYYINVPTWLADLEE